MASQGGESSHSRSKPRHKPPSISKHHDALPQNGSSHPPRGPRNDTRRHRPGARGDHAAGPSTAKPHMERRRDPDYRRTSSSHDSKTLSTPNTSTGSVEATAGFAAGQDFIAFDFSDDDDEEEEEIVRGKGKGKERADADARGRSGGLKRSAEERDLEEDGYANKKQRQDARSRLTPWVEDVDWDSCRNLAEMMHKDVKAFVEYISPRPEEHEVRGMVITAISRAIQSVWRDAHVYPFGSFETKLYLPLGDIDLVIQSQTVDNYDKKQILSKLAQVLRKANITDYVQVIGRAKVPIVKFVTSLGRFAVDISLNQGNGLTAGRIVNNFLHEFPALRSLVMVIKLFLSQRSMNEVYTGGLGSYAIVCMAVSFLQMHPKIRLGEIDPSENLGVLVMEFFELYGHYFNYDNTGISLRDGGTYFNKSARGWSDPGRISLLSIEDPIDISNDISRSSYNITRVRKTMAGAHEILTTAALMRARVLMSKAQGRYTNLSGPGAKNQEYDNPSILGSVMGVTQEMLNHRRMIRQLYEQNTLQNLLGLAPYRPTPIVAVRDTFDSRSRVVVSSKPASTSRSAKAVESAWAESDMDLGHSDDGLVASHLTSPDVEESRYSNRHRSKRRRLDANGKHTKSYDVFVSESDEEELVVSKLSHANHRSSKETLADWNTREARNGTVELEARRAYWASKGMPGGGLEDSD